MNFLESDKQAFAEFLKEKGLNQNGVNEIIQRFESDKSKTWFQKLLRK